MRAYSGAMSPPFVDHCVELLAPLGKVRVRRMFGGHGLYVDELFVAIIASERLYLKTDEPTRERFRAAGCAPFVYDAKRGAVALGYWSAPDEALEAPPSMQPWARLAIDAALRARAARVSRPRKAPAAAKGAATRRAKPASTTAKRR
jgi:DNA transformation protein